MFKRLLFGGLLTAVLAFAQGSMGGGQTGGGGDMGGGGMGSRGGNSGMGGEMGGGGMRPSMPTPLERMTTALTLNKDQKKQVKTIMDDAQKEAMPVKDQMLKGREAIAQAVAAGKSGDDLNAVISEYAASQTKMTQIELGAFVKIYQAVDKDQQAKIPPVLAMMNGIFKNKNWDSNPSQ
jgi:Spy/CpxP family protein refolding chaperone